MPAVVDIDVTELAATRFAMSPLGETVCGLLLLGARAARSDATLAPWTRWAAAETRRERLTLPTLWPLLATGRPSFPEFLTPAPTSAEPTIDDELAAMTATRAAQVRASLRRVFGADPTATARELAAAPAPGLRTLAAELRAAHDVLIAPHWPRLRALLAADIGHRARRWALGGAGALLGDLHADVRWGDGRLVVAGPDRHVTLGRRGLVLLPTALVTRPMLKLTSSTQISLRYRPRGAALLWAPPTEPPRDALVALVGLPRARLLGRLRAPGTTGALATELGVTAGAVSQHVGALRAAGLVHTERAGRAAIHQLSGAGEMLLAAVTARVTAG